MTKGTPPMTATTHETGCQVPDFELTPELQQFREQVRAYTKEHLQRAAEYDREARFPKEAVDAAARLGLPVAS